MPQPNYNQDTCYWCSKYMIDIEPDDDACEINGGMSNTCASCVFCEKQSYSIVVQREDQKHLIGGIMPKTTVEYEIDKDGNCFQCECSITDNLHRLYCKVFDELLNKRCDYAPEQCPACKDFLAKEAGKVYCNGCKHLDIIIGQGFTDAECEKQQNVIPYGFECSESFCFNCKQKETE